MDPELFLRICQLCTVWHILDNNLANNVEHALVEVRALWELLQPQLLFLFREIPVGESSVGRLWSNCSVISSDLHVYSCVKLCKLSKE